VLDLVWRDRETVVHPGDTFISDLDMTEENLPTGQVLAVGTAVLRVSEVWNDACAKWKVRHGAAAFDWVRAHPHLRLRGVLCSIEQDGVIRNGDAVEVLR
jgi:MOSC domain-containing protein YiiM